MGKSRAAKNCTILPWLSAKNDCRDGRFLQIGNSLLLSKEFQKLLPGSRMLYECMAMESGGKRNFVFPLKAAKKYGFSESSFRRYLNELIDSGFIDCQSNWNLREPNDYRFSLRWKENKPP